MKNGRTLLQLAEELQRQLASKRDMIVPTVLMDHQTKGGETSIAITAPDGVQSYKTTELFRRQLADKLKIPFAYFERMRATQPERKRLGKSGQRRGGADGRRSQLAGFQRCGSSASISLARCVGNRVSTSLKYA